MNYQKLFSRFYNPGEQQNIPDLPKCEGFGDVPPDESKLPNVTEDSTVDFDYQHEEDDTLMCEIENANLPWDTSLPEVPTVIEPISSEHVRWFYKAVDDKVWCEFNGYDTLLIENKYREYKIKADNNGSDYIDMVNIDKVVTDGTNFQHTQVQLDVKDELNKKDLNFLSRKISETDKSSFEFCKVNDISKIDIEHHNDYHTIDNINTIVVRGGMYEVDLKTMTCASIYWPGEQCIITRGLYFFDGSWQPVEGCFGEVIEEEYLRLYGQGSKNIVEAAIPQPGVAVHSHHFADFHVEWLSVCELYLYWGGAPRQLVRSVTQKLGFYQSTGYRLRRGYKNKATALERPPDITHVVFVIHGIGQKMDAGRIIRNTNALRTNCDWLRAQYASCSGKDRAELFPARWRAGERGSAAALLEAAAPAGAPALRRAINDAAMDVMYYTSPVYGKQVQDDLTQELNRLYTMFMARNPDYKGQFSAVAHSLGCVILYDIITGHKIGCERCISRDIETQTNKKEGLLFQLQKVFCLGSPLGVFLSLRQANSNSAQVLPIGFKTRLYNIFYLSDPVAYRLEPLVAKWLSDHPPLIIPPHYAAPSTSPSSQNSPAKAPWKIWSYVKHPWQKLESGTQLTNSPQNPSDLNESPCSKSQYFDGSPKKDSTADEKCEGIMYENSVEFNVESEVIQLNASTSNIDNEKCNISNPNSIIETVHVVENDSKVKDEDKDGKPEEFSNSIRNPIEVLPYRIDYSIKDSGITNNYIWAITSHTSYWNNHDVAYFILTRLFSEKEDRDLQMQNNLS